MVISLKELYPEGAEEQKKRYESIRKGFEDLFGASAGAEFFSAPGRTEVGGNHTDHNHGRVLAAAVNLDVVALAGKTDTGVVRLKSAEYPGVDEVDLSDLPVRTEEEGTSASVIRGICARCKELGFKIGGFDAYTMTRVLKGSGLSSSAAFEILLVTIISHLYNEGSIDPVTAAIIAQYAENVYFGKPSGLMDQMASSVGGFTSIDFANSQKPLIRKVPFDIAASGYVLCVVDTGGNHADLTCEYAAIPYEMRSVAGYFGKGVLREVEIETFYSHISELRKRFGDRAVLRAMHFFDEDRLAEKEAQALNDGDFEGFCSMIRTSGRSSFERLQNVLSISSPQEQGLALALALTEKMLGDRGACRVHGGGFAGTIQAFVPTDLLLSYRRGMEQVFGENSCYVLSVRQAGGTRVTL